MIGLINSLLYPETAAPHMGRPHTHTRSRVAPLVISILPAFFPLSLLQFHPMGI